MKSFPSVKIKSAEKQDMKEKLLQFIISQGGMPVTMASRDYLSSYKQNLLNELKALNLDYLLDLKHDKTVFEWKCALDLADILFKFDYLLEECDKHLEDEHYLTYRYEQLRHAMERFSKEYENEFIITQSDAEREFKISKDIQA